MMEEGRIEDLQVRQTVDNHVCNVLINSFQAQKMRLAREAEEEAVELEAKKKNNSMPGRLLPLSYHIVLFVVCRLVSVCALCSA